MFTAYSSDRTVRYALPSEPEAGRFGALEVDGTQARELAAALRCEDPHCDVPLVFRQSTDGSRRAHWAHPPHSASDCAAASGPEGEWHRRVKLGIFAKAHGHERTIAGARVDAVVSRVGSDQLTAIEIQHSPIAPETVEQRHRAHQAAGLNATVWIVDATAAGIVNDETWLEDSPYPGNRWHQGAHVRVVRTAWIVDLIEACLNAEETYRCTVALLTSPDLFHDAHVLRVVDRATISHEVDGSRIAVIGKMTTPVDESALREWAAGPQRVASIALRGRFRTLDGFAARRIKDFERFFDVTVLPTGNVRVRFEHFHHDNRNDGEALGLTWSRGSGGAVGCLEGPLTDDVERWLETTFGCQVAA